MRPTSIFQICTIAGPALGGVVYAVSGPALFATVTGLYALGVSQVLGLAAIFRSPDALQQRTMREHLARVSD